MKPEHPKRIKKDKSERKNSTDALKDRQPEVAQQKKPVASSKLREAYFTKIEWVKKRLPSLKEEGHATKETKSEAS